MGYAGITFLLFAAYVPLIWIIVRLWLSKQKGHLAATGIFAAFLMGVWIVGFVTRTMFVGALEHLIYAGSLSLIAVLIFEATRGGVGVIRIFKNRKYPYP